MSPEKAIETVQIEQVSRKVWETPKIVLERALIASAQGGPPSAPGGFVAPFSLSGGATGTICGGS